MPMACRHESSSGSYPFNKSYLQDPQQKTVKVPKHVKCSPARQATSVTLPSLRGSFRALPRPAVNPISRCAAPNSNKSFAHIQNVQMTHTKTCGALKAVEDSSLQSSDAGINALPQESRLAVSTPDNSTTTSSPEAYIDFGFDQLHDIFHIAKDFPQSSGLATSKECPIEPVAEPCQILRMPCRQSHDYSMNRLSVVSMTGLNAADRVRSELHIIHDEDKEAVCDQDFLNWLGTYDVQALVPSVTRSHPPGLEGRTVHEQLCMYGSFYAKIWEHLPDQLQHTAPILRALVVILDRRLSILEGVSTIAAVTEPKVKKLLRKAWRWLGGLVAKLDQQHADDADALQKHHALRTTGDRQIWRYPEPDKKWKLDH